MYYIITCDW